MGPIVVLAVVGTVATALTPALAARHPLLLITFEARNRNLVLARHVALAPFVVVAVLRRVSTDPLYYLLGRSYGGAAVQWLETRAGGGEYVRLVERMFGRASYPMVFLFPGAIVCALAGQTGMAPGVFLSLNVLGTLVAVLTIRLFGDVLGGPVDALIRLFDRHLVLTTTLTAGLVVAWVVVERVRGRGQHQSMEQIGDELERGGSDPEQVVEADGEARPSGDGLDGEDHTGHER